MVNKKGRSAQVLTERMTGVGLFTPDFLFKLIAFIIGLAVHEFGHAVMALWVGDDTPRRQGRVTLNPLAHLDVIGLLMIAIVNFGWAKPVVFDPRKIRINRQLGIVLIALAGPFMNALLALFSIFGLLLIAGSPSSFWLGGAGAFIENVVLWMAILNVALAVFNLIPIPPLDGWKILRYSLPRTLGPRLYQFEAIGPFFLVLMLFLPVSGWLITTTVTTVLGWFGLIV